ncbi:MAG: response regulator [Bryobacterales bacterium]|jgi:two-component system LytT family response regulator|nr:response regulator [Bryobacterales bacterium]
MSSPIRALIVDDEELARQVLREHLAAHTDIQLIGECANGFDAVKQVAELKPDLVFLDIQMPKLDGFEVLELLEERPLVVFVTAYDEFALKAFEIHAVDYLLKPFRKERFDAAILRVTERLRQPRPDYSLAARDSRPPGAYLERIVIRDGAKLHVLPLDRVDYILARDDYVGIHSGGKEYLKQQTLSSLEGALHPAEFVRIHRSAIVNLSRIERIEPYSRDSKVVLLSNGQQLPASRTGLAALEKALEGYRP